MEKEEQAWRGDFTDSEGDVGSLLDSIVDEDDTSLAAVSGDEGEEFSQFVDPTGRQQGSNSTYNSPHVVHDTRHQRRYPTCEATPMPAPRAMPPSFSHPHAPRSDGLTFDMSQPWQRSLLKQYDLQKSHPPARRKRPDLMYVLHTDSRDHGFSWDEGSAYSMDTSNGSTVPGHSQFVHRVHHPILYEPEQQHSQDRPHAADDAVSSMSETTRKEGRDDSTSRPLRPSPKTPPPRFVDTSVHLSPRSVMEQPRKQRNKQRNMHDTMKPYMVEPGGMVPPDPACYCLGYNVLDVLLPPQRRPVNRLSRVEEEVHGMQPPHGR